MTIRKGSFLVKRPVAGIYGNFFWGALSQGIFHKETFTDSCQIPHRKVETLLQSRG